MDEFEEQLPLEEKPISNLVERWWATEESGRDPDDESPQVKLTAATPDPTHIYLSEIGYSPLLNAEEEVYFARLAQRGDEKARQRMIVSNLR